MGRDDNRFTLGMKFVEQFHEVSGTAGLRELVGSSKTRTSGSIARVPAMAARFFSPPLGGEVGASLYPKDHGGKGSRNRGLDAV